MLLDVFIFIAGVFLAFGAAWWLTNRQTSRQQEHQLAVAVGALAKMGGVRVEGEPRIEGEHEGFAYRFELATRVMDGDAANLAECRVALPQEEVVFQLRARTNEPPVDHAFETGDREFDAAFTVEAAPRVYAERVLSSGLRAELLATRPREARWEKGELLVAKSGWDQPAAVTRRFVQLAVKLARHMALADEEALQAEVDPAEPTGDYRRLVPRPAPTTRGDEVDALRRKVGARERWIRQTDAAGTLIAVALFAMVVALLFFLSFYFTLR